MGEKNKIKPSTNRTNGKSQAQYTFKLIVIIEVPGYLEKATNEGEEEEQQHE